MVVLSETGGVQTAELRKVDDLNTCLDVQSSAAIGARSEWKGCSGSNFQRWKISPTSVAGEVRLETMGVAGRCITGANDWSLATIQTCDDSNPDRRWVIEAPSDNRTIVQIRSGATDGCLDVRGPLAQNTPLTDFPCLGAGRPTQAFLRLNSGAFVSTADPGLCLDRINANVGQEMRVWGCSSSSVAQQFTTTGNVLRHAGGLCEELTPASNNVTARTCVTSGPTLAYQTWFVEPVGSGGSPPVQLRNAAGWCMDVTVGFDTDAAQAIPCLGPSRLNQAFVFSGGGLVRLRSDPSLCLDSTGAGTQTRVIAYSCQSGNQNQTWTVDGGRLRNLRGATLGACVQGGIEGNRLTMETCSASADQ